MAEVKLHSSREGAARAREARAGRGGDAAAAQMARGGAGAAPAGAPARSAELVAAYTAEAAQTRAQRCACGKSKRFPLCDGAHEGFGWSCVRRKFTRLGFAADTVNQNVASRLAHQHRGALCLLPSDPLAAAPAHNSVETLMLVLDGSELAFLTELAGKANAERIVVISLGVAPRLLAPSFAAAAGRGLSVACVDLSAVAHDVSLVFRRISDIARDGVAGLPQDIRNNVFELPSLHSASLDASEVVASAALAGSPGAAEDAAPAPATPQAPPLPRVFVSHAVSDEAVILPVVDRLRALYGLEAFVCADSIADGADWAGAIAAALEASDCFLLLLSAAVRRSHFCSFEVGYAVGKGVPLRIISLDGTLPPAFVQHVHMRDLPRVQRAKPWLSDGDVLLDEVLSTLASCPPREGPNPAASETPELLDGEAGGDKVVATHTERGTRSMVSVVAMVALLLLVVIKLQHMLGETTVLTDL